MHFIELGHLHLEIRIALKRRVEAGPQNMDLALKVENEINDKSPIFSNIA